LLTDWEYQQSHEEVHGRAFNGPEGTEEMLYQIPQSLVARLAMLTSNDCDGYGAAWARQGDRDVEIDGPESGWIMRLSELAAFAKRAVAEHRGMYLWMSV
jgi:hypothetical protein